MLNELRGLRLKDWLGLVELILGGVGRLHYAQGSREDGLGLAHLRLKLQLELFLIILLIGQHPAGLGEVAGQGGQRGGGTDKAGSGVERVQACLKRVRRLTNASKGRAGTGEVLGVRHSGREYRRGPREELSFSET